MEKKIQRHEGFFKGYNDDSIFYQTWLTEKPIAHIIITHGMGEHSESYHRLIKYFENKHFSFYGWDLRGHGRSDGKRGFVSHFNDYLYDYELFFKELKKNFKFNEPIILLGHSMGGLIQTKFLIQNELPFKLTAQVLSSPLFGFSLPVPKIKDWAARVLNSSFPRVTLGNELSDDMLTRDPLVIKEFEKDHLRHHLISSSVYLGMVEGFQFVKENAYKISYPTIMQISETDPVVSTTAAKEIFNLFPNPKKKLLLYGDDARHENYNDSHRQHVYQDLETQLGAYL